MNSIEDALQALRDGRPVLVTDDESRENEGDVVLAAQTATQEWMAWTVRHSSGYLCAPMPAALADRLDLPPMVRDNTDPLRTAYTVSVDAKKGVTTGISAADRLRTVQVLGDPRTTAGDLVRPGHVLPLRARDGGVLERRGHTEAAVDLCRLAGLSPVGVIGELVHDDGSMMRRPAVLCFGAQHDLPVITIQQLVCHRQRHDRVEEVARTLLPTEHGMFEARGFRDLLTGAEHLALTSPRGAGAGSLVRVHSECLTGDVFGSLRCDCGPQLADAMARIAIDGGVIVYLRGHEGRGVGLLEKLRAYAQQDAGADTVEAQEQLGLPVDAREYAAAAAILHSLEICDVRLISNNPAKRLGLQDNGIEVRSMELSPVRVSDHNLRYVQTKRDRMGHDLPDLHEGATV